MFRAAIFWLGFHPGKNFTSRPTRWLNTDTELASPGLATAGGLRAAQKSQVKSQANLMASSDAWPCFRILTKSLLDGCPKFLCNLCRVLLSFLWIRLFSNGQGFEHWCIRQHTGVQSCRHSWGSPWLSPRNTTYCPAALETKSISAPPENRQSLSRWKSRTASKALERRPRQKKGSFSLHNCRLHCSIPTRKPYRHDSSLMRHLPLAVAVLEHIGFWLEASCGLLGAGLGRRTIWSRSTGLWVSFLSAFPSPMSHPAASIALGLSLHLFNLDSERPSEVLCLIEAPVLLQLGNFSSSLLPRSG